MARVRPSVGTNGGIGVTVRNGGDLHNPTTQLLGGINVVQEEHNVNFLLLCRQITGYAVETLEQRDSVVTASRLVYVPQDMS
jgi:hypothetical protein